MAGGNAQTAPATAFRDATAVRRHSTARLKSDSSRGCTSKLEFDSAHAGTAQAYAASSIHARRGSWLRGSCVDQFVEHVPLARDIAQLRESRRGLLRASDSGPCRPSRTTFSSIIRLPMSLAPYNRAIWPIFSPCVTQLDWMLAKVVEVQPADGLRLQILERAGRRHVGHVGMLGLKRPADIGGEAAASRPAIGATAPDVRSARPAFRHGRTSSWPCRGRPARATRGRRSANRRSSLCRA